MARKVEIVYPVCCGMDVHKSFIVACVAIVVVSLLTPAPDEDVVEKFETIAAMK